MYIRESDDKKKLLFFEKGEEKPLGYCPYVEVEDYIFTIPESLKRDVVKMLVNNGNFTRRFNLSPADVSDLRTLMAALASNMCCVESEFQLLVQRRILFQMNYKIEKDLIQYEHKNLGFLEFRDQPLFFSDKTCIDGTKYSFCTRENVGAFTGGDANVYHQMLEDYVYPSDELSLAFVIGLSAITSGRLHKKGGIGCPIYVFSGKSSSGKTLAASLSISAFMSCDPEESVLMTKLNSTRLGLTAQLQNISCLPVCFDDARNNFRGNILDEIYTLASGTPRTTSNVNSEAVVRNGWRCSIIMTAETSILDEGERFSGMDVRLIDLNSIQWTKSAEECDAIREVIDEHFGWVGFRLGEHVCQKPFSQIYSDFKECRNHIQGLISSGDSLSGRVANKYASIYLAGKYYNELFGEKLRLDAIMNLIIANETKLVRQRDAALDCYQSVYDFYKLHLNQFVGNLGDNYHGVIYGRATIKNEGVIVSISNTILKDIMIRNGYPQYKNYLPEWEKRGFAKIISTNSANLGRHVDFYFRDNDTFVQSDFPENLKSVKTDAEIIKELKQQINSQHSTILSQERQLDEQSKKIAELEKIEEEKALDEIFQD